jgi:hypothetical protein
MTEEIETEEQNSMIRIKMANEKVNSFYAVNKINKESCSLFECTIENLVRRINRD